MKQIYTCYFKKIPFDKTTVKDSFFVSLDKTNWIGISYVPNLSIKHYKEIKILFTPTKRWDKKEKIWWTCCNLTAHTNFLYSLGVRANEKVVIKTIR
tara:strand:+ start:260 stop:550 length:291 start_codon:yes stop_codon:yes gene_type:complete